MSTITETIKSEIKELESQQLKRNLIISGLAISGGIIGFIAGHTMKTSVVNKVLLATGGTILVGLPVFLITNKKYNIRKQSIIDKKDQLERIKNIQESPSRPLSQFMKDGLSSIAKDLTGIITKNSPKPGSGVYSNEYQNQQQPSEPKQNNAGSGVLAYNANPLFAPIKVM